MFIEFNKNLVNLNNVTYIHKDNKEIYINFHSPEDPYIAQVFDSAEEAQQKFNELKDLLIPKPLTKDELNRIQWNGVMLTKTNDAQVDHQLPESQL